jgi:peroxiredoxin
MKKNFFALLALLVYNFTIAQMDPQGLPIGAAAPNFSAKDQNGKAVVLKDVLKQGPAVLIFYRGEWCPYCNKQLSELNDSIRFIVAKGAKVIAISPENNMYVEKTVKKTKATYSIISDNDTKIMADYKVNFTPDPEITAKYKSHDIDLSERNEANKNTLPVPAVYIVDRSGKITYKHIDANIMKRASVKEILNHL